MKAEVVRKVDTTVYVRQNMFSQPNHVYANGMITKRGVKTYKNGISDETAMENANTRYQVAGQLTQLVLEGYLSFTEALKTRKYKVAKQTAIPMLFKSGEYSAYEDLTRSNVIAYW